MRVLILTAFYPSSKKRSEGPFIHEQVTALSRAGVLTVVLAPIPWAPWPLPHIKKIWHEYAILPKKEVLDGICIYRPRYLRMPGAWFFPFAGIFMALSLILFCRRMHRRSKFDLIHANTLAPYGFSGYLIAKFLKLPLLCISRGGVFLYPQRNRLSAHVIKTVIQKSDQIVTVSQALKQRVESLARPRREIRVVYNGCDTKAFSPVQDKASVRQRLGLPHRAKILLYVGRLVFEKGISELLQAFQQINDPSCHLVLVGDGEAALEVADWIRLNGLTKRSHVIGARPHTEIPLWMQSADIFVHPSHSEGLPNSVMEAMSCALAVIATQVGGTPEIVQTQQTGILIPPKDVPSLLAAILRLLHDSDLCDRMGQAARAWIVASKSWEENGRALIEIYRTLC